MFVCIDIVFIKKKTKQTKKPLSLFLLKRNILWKNCRFNTIFIWEVFYYLWTRVFNSKTLFKAWS